MGLNDLYAHSDRELDRSDQVVRSPIHLDDLLIHVDDLPIYVSDLPIHVDDLPVHVDDLPMHVDGLPVHVDDLPVDASVFTTQRGDQRKGVLDQAKSVDDKRVDGGALATSVYCFISLLLFRRFTLGREGAIAVPSKNV